MNKRSRPKESHQEPTGKQAQPKEHDGGMIDPRDLTDVEPTPPEALRPSAPASPQEAEQEQQAE